MLSLNTHPGPLCTSFCAPETDVHERDDRRAPSAAASRSGPGPSCRPDLGGPAANRRTAATRTVSTSLCMTLPELPQSAVSDVYAIHSPANARRGRRRANDQQRAARGRRPGRRRGPHGGGVPGVPAHHRQAVAQRSGPLGDLRPVAGGEAQGDDGREEDLDLGDPEARARRDQALVDPRPESRLTGRRPRSSSGRRRPTCGCPRRTARAIRSRRTDPTVAGSTPETPSHARTISRWTSSGSRGRSGNCRSVVTRTGFVSETSSGSSVPSRCSATSSSRVWSARPDLAEEPERGQRPQLELADGEDRQDRQEGPRHDAADPGRALLIGHRTQPREENVRLGRHGDHRHRPTCTLRAARPASTSARSLNGSPRWPRTQSNMTGPGRSAMAASMAESGRGSAGGPRPCASPCASSRPPTRTRT